MGRHSLKDVLIFVCIVGLAPAQQAAPAVRVLGRVTNVLGAAVPAAEVWATAKERVVGRTIADGDGNYRLARLAVAPDAEVVVHARAEGFVELAQPTAMRGALRVVPMELEEGVVLAGTCVQADGRPIVGACVAASSMRDFEWSADWRQEATTDAHGAWRLAAAPLRALHVCAWAPGFELAAEGIEHPAEGLRLVLAPSTASPRSIRVTGMPAHGLVEARCVGWHDTAQAVDALPSALRMVVVAADGTAQLWPLPVHHDVQIVAADLVCEPRTIACLTPTNSAHSLSSSATRRPWATMPLARTSVTAAVSSGPKSGRAIGIMRLLLGAGRFAPRASRRRGCRRRSGGSRRT
jgi:hypothetical protein